MAKRGFFVGKSKTKNKNGGEPVVTQIKNDAKEKKGQEDYLLRTSILKTDWPLEKIANAAGMSVIQLLDSEKLSLRNQEISGIRNLGNLKKLKMLDLSHTKVEDINVLNELKNLEWINLWGTLVADLSPLKELKKLKALNITDTKIKDISVLKKLPLLEVLQISNNNLKILDDLKNLKCLKRLYFFSAWLSSEEMLELQVALPECKIVNL